MRSLILPFKPVLPYKALDIDVGLLPILEAMGRNESKAETKRLFSVLVNALYALNILDESEWESILMAVAPEQVVRRLP